MSNIKPCSGQGSYHTDRLTSLTKLYPVYSSLKDTTPDEVISLADLGELAVMPTTGAKEQAKAITPFKANAKTKEAAIESQYHALVADHDDDDKSKEDIAALYDPWNVAYLAFTSSSHMQDKKGVTAKRWKLVLPLAYPIDRDFHAMLSRGLALINKTDLAQSRAQQVFFAPNKLYEGAPFASIDNIERNFLNPYDADHALIKACIEAYEEELNAKHAKANAAPIKSRKAYTGEQAGTIDKVCQCYDLEHELRQRGYTKKGKGYLSPYSSTGVAGVIILAGSDGKKRCYSHHGASDPLSNLNNDGHALDVFDVICILDFGGDVSQAVAALVKLIDPQGQKDRQREYMQEQEALKVQEAMDNLLKSDGEPNDNGEPANDPIFDLTRFSLMGMAAEMEAKMLDDKFILGGMAILGQSTVFYAKPNAGKTLLTIWLLIEAIKKAELNGNDIFYINADDNHKGLTHKLKLAETNGFHMLAPGYKDFNAGQLSLMLSALVKQGTARGKVLILDTVKKFTDIMDKKVGSAFGESVRQFVGHGGSMIMLAHVNKHRDSEGGLIFSGTSDVVDDVDCAYLLDEVTEDKLSGERTVKFENIKSRGDVSREEVYRYDAGQGVSYQGRLESVQRVSDEEREKAERQKRVDNKLEQNKEAIEVIKEVIREGITKKTELISAVADRSGITKRKITKALTDHTGSNIGEYQYWHVNKEDKNAQVYKLNWGVL